MSIHLCDVPNCLNMAAFGALKYCPPHDFAWSAPQELRDDQIVGPGVEWVDGWPRLGAVALQPLLAQMRLEVAAVEGLLV